MVYFADTFFLAGSSQKTPTTLTEACEFNSCPSGSPAVGNNASEPRLNYVNSYPATSMKYGINSIGPQFFNGVPDLAVAGPNVSRNDSGELVEIFHTNPFVGWKQHWFGCIAFRHRWSDYLCGP